MLLVSYHFQGPEEDYTAFFDVLLKEREFYCFAPGCYLVDAGGAKPLRDQLLPHLAGEDRLRVVEFFKGHCAGQLPAAGRDWLRRTLFQRVRRL